MRGDEGFDDDDIMDRHSRNERAMVPRAPGKKQMIGQVDSDELSDADLIDDDEDSASLDDDIEDMESDSTDNDF